MDGDGMGDLCTFDCDNGADDDGDGFTDHPDDPGCDSPTDDSEQSAGLECDDGFDNDSDGDTDLLDAACFAPHVGIEGPGLRRRMLTASASGGRPRGIPIMVMHDPVVMRVHVEDASSRSIAVGIPGGMNFVFDAEECRVQFGWAGMA